jgi:cbb3-type cytochrome oxidase subunit 3
LSPSCRSHKLIETYRNQLEDYPLNFVKLFIVLCIVLVAYRASAQNNYDEDNNGNVQLTDDANQVLEEQSESFSTEVEYDEETDLDESDTNNIVEPSEQDAALEDEFDEETMNETEQYSDDFADVDEDQDETDIFTVEEDEQDVANGQNPSEEVYTNLSDGAEAEADLDAMRIRLEVMKKDIEREYRILTKEKEDLTKEEKALKGGGDVLIYNRKVDRLNKRIEAYAKKRKALQTRVEAHNNLIR